MNILLITNFYPPHHLGGYEQRCQDVALRLEARGHNVSVLTSTFGVGGPAVEGAVHRVLTLESDIYHYQLASLLRLRGEVRDNLDQVRQVVASFQPDVIFIWGMWNLSKLIAREAEDLMGSRVAYSVADLWPERDDAHLSYWRKPARRRSIRTVKRIVSRAVGAWLKREGLPVRLDLKNVICVSEFLRDHLVHAGLPVEDAKVIYSGIALDEFLRPEAEIAGSNGGLSMLYAGRLVKEKGAHTAVQAVAELNRAGNADHLHLTLIGWGPPDYKSYLSGLVRDSGIEGKVAFLGPVRRTQMPEIYGRFDILVFPSIWEEPFSRTLLEAMASGLAVVGTTTGGSQEILVDGENALTFVPGDVRGLSRQIQRLQRDPALRSRLSQTGKQTVSVRFDIERMVDEMEACLVEVVRRS